jgi:hypothetical protein
VDVETPDLGITWNCKMRSPTYQEVQVSVTCIIRLSLSLSLFGVTDFEKKKDIFTPFRILSNKFNFKRIVFLDFIHRLVSQDWLQGFMCLCAQVGCSVVCN